MDPRRLRVEQLDRALAERRPAVPATGWIKAVREALGMTSRQLASRMGISQPNVLALERREALGTASLAQIRKAANALDCDLHYVLVPRLPLAEQVDGRATALARHGVQGVTHSMRLEAQEPGRKFVDRQVAAQARTILAGPWSRIWQQDET